MRFAKVSLIFDVFVEKIEFKIIYFGCNIYYLNIMKMYIYKDLIGEDRIVWGRYVGNN
jgi:hypothetical protein